LQYCHELVTTFPQINFLNNPSSHATFSIPFCVHFDSFYLLTVVGISFQCVRYCIFVHRNC